MTISRAAGGVDSAFSLEPSEMASLVVEVNRAFDALGRVFYGLEVAEGKASAGKRSIYAARNIAIGDLFTKDNIRVIRPGYGLHPKYFQEIIGQRATRGIALGQPLSERDIY
jgi:N-acetylneuraminate synthase